MIDLLLEKADTLAQAICRAEGGSVPGSLPFRCHNPGDLELGDRGWGIEQKKTIFAKADWTAGLDDRTDGASALRRECTAILSGGSHEYAAADTFAFLSRQWTGNDNADAWCKIVCEELAVTQQTTLRQYLLQDDSSAT